MTSRHWKIFTTVADCGTMSEAARRLQITQPSISQAVSEIERTYDVLLFERRGRRLCLTEVGRSFLPYARRMLSLETEMDAFLRSAAASRHLRVGATVTVGTCLMAPITEALARCIPGIRTEVSVANTAQIEERLLGGELDIGLVEGHVRSPDLRTEHVIRDTMVFICAMGHPYQGRGRITLEDLAGQPLILREEGSGTRAQLEEQLRLRGIPMDVRWDCCNTEAILNAVARGHGVSVLSRRLVDEYVHRQRLWVAEIDGVDFERCFDLVCYKDKLLSEELLAFMEICRAYDGGNA